MYGVCRVTDMCTGHGFWPPRQCDGGSQDVYVDGSPVHRVDDHWIIHCYGSDCHDSTLLQGSYTVFANGRGVGRVKDPVVCGSKVATGSNTVFAG